MKKLLLMLAFPLLCSAQATDVTGSAEADAALQDQQALMFVAQTYMYGCLDFKYYEKRIKDNPKVDPKDMDRCNKLASKYIDELMGK